MERDGVYKINGKESDIGLYKQVYDGTDDLHDELLLKEKLLKKINDELERRGANIVNNPVLKEALSDI